MTEYEHFMVYELDDSGEKVKLNILEEELKSSLHPEQVLVIIREDLRRIFIWKGGKSPVRKRFISSRVAQGLQEELMKDARYHRCKIVSVDAGDEPSEFLSAFGLESMEVTERLPDMHYIRNIEREKMQQGAAITDIQGPSKPQKEEEYFSPALQDTSNDVVISSFAAPNVTPKRGALVQKSRITSPTPSSVVGGLSEAQKKEIMDRILKTEAPDNYKRQNLILGHTLYAAVSKIANVFGEDVEETEWEPVKKVPKVMIELEEHLLRVYFDEKKGTVEAVEVLKEDKKSDSKTPAKKNSSKTTTTKPAPKKETSMTPMPPKPNSLKSTEKKQTTTKTTGRRQLPKVPSKDN